jgi:predicted O-linked N-acetylglucosamine transferase (SPINDLY family)
MTPIMIEQAMQIAIGHHQAGRLDEAVRLYRQVLTQHPDHAGALHLLGVLACQAGRLDASIDLIGRAIAVDPSVAEYHSDRGESYRRSGRPDEAIAGYQRAIELKPGLALAHSNLANALWGLGRLDEACIAGRRAIDLEPGFAEAYNNLGNVLKDLGRFDEAIAAFGRAIQLTPGFAEAHNNLGCTLSEQGNPEAAIAAVGRGIELKPDLAEAYNNLGNALRETGRIDEALDAFRKALALRPDLATAASGLVYALHFHPDFDAQAIVAEHRAWARAHAEPLAAEIRPHENDRAPKRRLRVAFLSPDFRDHAVGRALLPLFAHHDRRQTEFVAYSDVRAADRITANLKALADRWLDVADLSDRRLADRIREDGCDLLVDLALHTAGNRLPVFARKPAPVQVTMLGLPATTGLETIDVRLTDPYLDPPGMTDGDYTERSLRLPRCFWCYQPAEDAPTVGALPAEKNAFVTFGCLNQFAKVSRPALELWVKILQSLAGSRLVIHAPPGAHRLAVQRLFQEAGIAPERIAFVARVPRRSYLGRYHDLDLCLDPFPYNGGITTMDSLWMGVPVITLAGRTAVGRAGVSILANVGLPELIARTPEQYVRIAIDWAGDLARLRRLRSGLRQRMQASPLMDGAHYAAAVEAAFRQAWRTWCGQ